MAVSIRKSENHEHGGPKKPSPGDDLVYLDDSPFEMGEGTASVYKSHCDRHLKDTWHISGYNEGGHDSMSICLECAADIDRYLRHKEESEKEEEPYEGELFGADPNCRHNVKPAPGGGVKCTRCAGWFCF